MREQERESGVTVIIKDRGYYRGESPWRKRLKAVAISGLAGFLVGIGVIQSLL